MEKTSKITFAICLLVFILATISFIYSYNSLQNAREIFEDTCSNICDDYLIKYDSCFCGDIQPIDFDGRLYKEIGGDREVVIK